MANPPTQPDSPPRRWPRFLVRGLLLGLALALAAEVGRVAIGRNFHTVLPGRVYRCAQPSPADLRQAVVEYGIRTVLNLRGFCDPQEWYLEECRATRDLDLSQEDVCLSAGRLPSTHEVRRIVEILDGCEYPVLIHCRRGADRTGLASVIALLLHTELPLEQARRQLGPRYAHLAIGRPRNLQRFFDLYEEWLTEQGRNHSPAAFRTWADHGYCPAECRYRMEVLSPPQVTAGRPTLVRLRVHNTSVRPWRFRPGDNAGIHAAYAVTSESGGFVARDKAGLLHADVAPGEFIDLDLALPALGSPGRHTLVVDLTDEQHCAFFQVGQEPFRWMFEVAAP